jgi:hypothetical protein
MKGRGREKTMNYLAIMSTMYVLRGLFCCELVVLLVAVLGVGIDGGGA